MKYLLQRALVLVFAMSLPAHAVAEATEAASMPYPASMEADMLLLEVVIDRQKVFDALTAYQSNDDVLLPLGELSRLLTIGITVDPKQKAASGFVLKPNRTFSLDLEQATVWLNGRAVAVDLQQVHVQPDDIYVSSRLLSRWLPVDLDVDMSRLSLVVRPREPLPLQFRLERQAKAARLAQGSKLVEREVSFPQHDVPYRAFRAPFIDQTLSLDYQGGGEQSDLSGRYSGYATGDLLGMQGALYVNTGFGDGSTDVRWTLGRNDPDARLLGPLHARTAMFGSVSLPGVDGVSRTSATGKGLIVSNRPLSDPTGFGQHSLQGPLPPGWDVELYYNDVLVGFQSGTQDGQYHFDEQPLVFGANVFRLVFHGPLGQVRVETETYLLDQSLTAAGEFRYHVAHQRDEEGQARTAAQFDWGLSEHVAIGAGLSTIPVAGVTRQFTNVGLQTHWRAMILSGNFVKSDDGTLGEVALRTRLGGWAISASHAALEDFSSELFLPSNDQVKSDSWLRVDGSFPLPESSVRLPMSLEANYERRASGVSSIDVAGRVSAHIRGTSMTGQLRWRSLSGLEFSDASFQISRRLRGVSMRGQLIYALVPEQRLSAVAISADRRVGEGYLQSLGITRMFDSSETLYSMGLTKSVGSIGYGVNTGYSTAGAFSVGVQVFLAMGLEPRRSNWTFDAQPMANTGAASARVFLDDNLNGRMDAGEQPVEGVAFEVNGGKHPVKTGPDGVAYLARLPIMEHSNIQMVTASLDDPQWMSRTTGWQMTPRPGAVAELDFPVITTSEVEGTVYAVEAGVRRGAGSLLVQLVDVAGNVVMSTNTAADGYYVFTKVLPGSYRVRVASEELERFKFTASPLQVNVSADEWLTTGADILLEVAP